VGIVISLWKQVSQRDLKSKYMRIILINKKIPCFKCGIF
jgi:hypothetical protein